MSVSNAQTDEDTSLNKCTQIARYLNYRSHHPVHVKRWVIKSLYDRAMRVTTHDTKERMHLRKVFIKNGYPEEFLSATLNHIASAIT